MRHAPAAAFALALALIPAAAQADGASFLGQISIGTATTAGGIGDEMETMNLPIMNLGVGFRTRRIGALASGDMMAFAPHDATLDGKDLISFAGGVEIAGFQPLGRKWELYGRAGRRWRWMGSSSEVIRTCNQTGTCAGGFWPEQPSYTTAGMIGAVGMQRTFRDKGVAAGIGLELRVEEVSMPLPGRGVVGGVIVLFSMNFFLGGSGFLR